jgi:DNA-binding transcriptional LysR family regulator
LRRTPERAEERDGVHGIRFALLYFLVYLFSILLLLESIVITSARLRHVVALAEHRTFLRAAEMLRITQPALTKSIQVLEATLGVKVFDRQPGGVVLTEFGELIVEHTRDVLASEGELLRRIGQLAGLESGRINVAFGPYPSVMAGYSTVARLSAKYPKLNIALHVANWREVTRWVAEKKVDVGVAELSDAVLDDALQTELVGNHLGRYFCRPRHPILKLRRVTLADLLQFPWATNRIPPRIAAALPRPPGAAGYIDDLSGEFVPAIELDVPMQIATLLANTNVIALGSFSMAEKELDAGTVAVIPTPDLKFRASYGFIYLKNRALSPATKAFMEEYRDEERVVAEREERCQQRYLPAKQRSS